MRILWKYFRKDWWRCFRSASLEAYNKMLSLHMFFHLNHHRYIMQKNNFVTFTEKHNFTQQVSPSWEFFRAAIIFLKKMKNIKTWMIVKEKHFCYILLTDQISLSDFFYFLRYLTNCLSKLFAILYVTSQILKIACIIKLFFYITWRSEQKFKNEKKFWWYKSIFHQF